MKYFGRSSSERYHESDSYGDSERKLNRFGEERIRHDPNLDNDLAPFLEDESGMRYPHEDRQMRNHSSWDLQTEVSSENHQGKGPKGYQRKPLQIYEEACELLCLDHYVDATAIEVKVVGNILILSGTVKNRAEKKRAEQLVESITGVEDVHNRLVVWGTN